MSGRDNNWRGKMRIPRHAHPLIREFVKLLNERNMTLTEAAKKSGNSRDTLDGWRYKSLPRLDLFEAALNVAGYELCIREKRIVESA
jgi:hypothetical protein